jgi:aminoglycoside-2''-adenylyltransferase
VAVDGVNDLGPWLPLTVVQTAELLAGLRAQWWIAGGWAIDLFLGRQTRPHADTDVLVLRRDQQHVWRHLFRAGWEVWAVDRPGHLTRCRRGEILRKDAHDAWCRPNQDSPWALEVILEETLGDRWVYRRDSRATMPLREIGLKTVDGIPYLAPEVQLLFKSKSPRSKDEADFELTVAELPARRRQWLASALGTISPEHPWLARL